MDLGNNIQTGDLINLIKDIFECIEADDGNNPIFTVFNDEIAVLEIEGKRFRIHIEDTRKFN